MLLTYFTLGVATFSYAQNDQQPYLTKTFSGSSLSKLSVITSGGAIEVEGGSASSVKVEMYVRPNNWNGRSTLSKEELEDRLDDYDIVIRTEGNTVVASARRRESGSWNSKRSLSISFKVFTPRNFSTDLMTSGGSIRLASLNGTQKFKTSGGSIKVRDIKGNIDGLTSGGSITAENCSPNVVLTTSGGSITASNSSGAIVLKTSGGSLTLSQLSGQIEASTSGGSIQVKNVKGELVARTSGGGIRLEGVEGNVDASTSGGGIQADVVAIDDYLKLRTSAGSVQVNMPLSGGLDLDLRGSSVKAPLRNFDGQSSKNRINGRMNGGGKLVQLSTSAGSVSIN